MNPDNLLPERWPDQAVTGLDAWRQGHLIRGGALTWLSPGGAADAVVGTDARGEAGTWVAFTDQTDGYFALVSQTCDIAAEGPGSRHATVQVCPVRNIDDFPPDKITAAKRHELGDYVVLSKPPVPGVWAVDLRLSIPLSKAALLTTNPISCFAAEADELTFGERIAQKYRRPALHDLITTDLVQSLRSLIKVAKKQQEDWCDEVEQVRVLVLEGTRLNPRIVRLLIVTEEVMASRKSLKRWRTAQARSLRKQGITLAPSKFITLDKMKVVDYRNSVPVRLPELEREYFA